MQRKWRRTWERQKTGLGLGTAHSIMKTAAKCLLPPLVAAGIMVGSMGIGHAAVLPTGGAIVNGNGTITVNGSTMTVNQYTARMIANWENFSIGNGDTVNFIQPDSRSVALNRVLGNDASSIYGNLNANGQVFLINPNGILFSPTSQVNVGSLVTSSLNISDSDFLAGNYKFSGSDNSGPVLSQGSITAKNGGYVALLGPQVRNEGVIVAQKGTVALGAGKAVTLDFNGDGLLNMAVDQAAVNASAVNHNLIQADGGQVIMTGRAAKDLAGTVVNNSGIIQARSIDNKNGVIRLDGGTSGAVTNSGTLDASGRAAGQTGGTVRVLGDSVDIAAGSNIDVAGDRGGGTALIGGNYQGQGPEYNATTAYVDKDATINADAITSGNGGKVVVWADDKTTYSGTISAKGGANGGDGGQVETSGKKTLTLSKDARVVTLAPRGRTGNWLLDPTNYTIGTGQMGANYWNNADLGTALGSSSITVQTATTGSEAGDITVSAPVSWSSANSLTLSAYHDVNVYAEIKNTGGATVTLRADNTGIGSGTVRFTGGNTGHIYTDGAVNIYYNPTSYTDTATRTTWDAASGVLAGPYGAYVKKANGTDANNQFWSYMLVNNVTQLQSIRSSLTGVYALGRDIDASATRTLNNGQGFIPIGTGYTTTSTANAFTGIFDGGGYTIDNLYINYTRSASGNARVAGLFGMIGAGGTVRNLGLTNVDITGSNNFEFNQFAYMYDGSSTTLKQQSMYVGGLAGVAESATIDNVFVTGKVTGNNANGVGGLVGLVYEGRTGSPVSVINSFSSAAVTANGYNNRIAAGGLIGELDYNTLTTNLDSYPIIDTGTGFVKNSYSSGPVTVNHTGVDGIQHSTLYAGGLVGLNQGASIDQAYSTGDVTVNSTDAKSTVHAGGLVGASTDYSFTQNQQIYNNPLMATFNGETISRSYSTGKVSYGGDQTYVGGFAGSNAGVISQSFWDTDRSGQAKGIGANTGGTINLTGLKTAQMVAQSSFSGWDFAKDWFMLDGYTTPFLRSEYSTRINNAHQLQLMALNPAAHYTLATDLDLRGYNMAPGVGFVPVNNFSGSFDGQGHTISYLNIHDYGGADAVGLFARTVGGAAIHNVALANASVSGIAANRYVGILAGDNAAGSQIYNTYTGGAVSGSGNVGGSAGSNAGTLATSFSAAKVTGPAGTTGGLAGVNSGTISESYLDADASVNGSAGPLAPLAGSNTGTITAPTDSGANWVSLGSNRHLAWTVAPDGTVSLYTPSQLQAIQNYLNGSYRLRADLDLAGRNWTPIGTASGNAFTGKLDGGGYVINKLTISNSPLSAIGLFGYTQGAALSNLTLTNVNVAGGAGNTYVGGLVGYSNGGSINNVTVGGKGTVLATGSGSYVGGIAGYNSGSIARAVNGMMPPDTDNAATVSAAGTGSAAGGLVGVNAAGGSISLASNTGTVTVNGPGSYAGGLTGQNAGTIALSFNTGAVTGSGANSAGSSVGGIAGQNTGTIGSTTGFVYNTGAVTTQGDDSYVGGIAGENTGIIGFKTNSATTGTVYNKGSVTALGARSFVGGVAGKNTGAIGQAYTAAVVTAKGANSYVGGIAGLNDTGGSIVSAFFGAAASGDVAKVESSGTNSSVGGIAGANKGSIANTIGLGVVSSTGATSSVGGLIGDNVSGSLATSYVLGAVQGTADSSVGGLIGSNSGTVANVVWNREATGRQNGVGSGTNAGTALSYTQIISGSATNWSGWSTFTTNWTKTAGLFPRLSWSPTYMLYGRVIDGGPGVTVNKYDYSYVTRNIVPYTTQTIGADGLFLMPAGGTQYNGETPYDKEGPPQTLLFTVAGQPYKANSIYATGLSGRTVFYDLKKDTLLFSIADVTPRMKQYLGSAYQFTFYRLFVDKVSCGAVVAATADQYPDLMYTLGPVFLAPGDGHDPGGVHDNIFVHSLDVAGNFEAKNFDWYALDGSMGSTQISAGSVTTHKTAYANGDITIDNSQRPVTVYSYAGDETINDTKQLISANGVAAKFVAAGDLAITEPGNIAIGVGSGPRLIAGGDITITTGGMFVNWAGPDAIQAGGRYLIYAQDMLLASWLAGADPSSPGYWAAYNNRSSLFFGTRYNDYTYETAMRLTYLNDHLVVDTRGGVPGFAVWGYKAGDSLPAGSGFIYTAGDPGTAGRPWLTPGYFAEQDRRQWAADTAQADNAGRPGLAADSATPDVRNGSLQAAIVDGGVALPADTDDTNQGKE